MKSYNSSKRFTVKCVWEEMERKFTGEQPIDNLRLTSMVLRARYGWDVSPREVAKAVLRLTPVQAK